MGIDGRAARVVGAVLVVLVHTNQFVRPGPSAWWPAGVAGLPLYGVAVPLFLVLSGVFTGRAGVPADAGTLFRRVRRVGPPLVVWSAVILALGVVPTQPHMWAQHLLLGAWQLYYLCVLLQLTAISVVVERRVSDARVWALVLGGLLVTALVYGWSDWLLWRQGSDEGAFERDLRRTFLPWTGFFALGVGLRRIQGAPAALRSAAVPLVLLTVPAWVLFAVEMSRQEGWIGTSAREQFLLGGLPLQILGTLAVLSCLERWREQAWVRWLARHADLTLGVYLCHTAMLTVIYRTLRTAGLTTVHPIEVPLVAALVGVCSVAFVVWGRRLLPRPVAAVLGLL